jgi:hypothetical protein
MDFIPAVGACVESDESENDTPNMTFDDGACHECDANQYIIEQQTEEINKHKRNAMWNMFLLTNYRNSCRIDKGALPPAGSTCYRCSKKYRYSYETSKDWFVMLSGTVSCKDCMPPVEWLDHIIESSENRIDSCSSTSKENTDFSISSRWLVDLIDGQHSVYCTD